MLLCHDISIKALHNHLALIGSTNHAVLAVIQSKKRLSKPPTIAIICASLYIAVNTDKLNEESVKHTLPFPINLLYGVILAPLYSSLRHSHSLAIITYDTAQQ